MHYTSIILSTILVGSSFANPVAYNGDEAGSSMVDNVLKRANVEPVQCGPSANQKAYTPQAVQTAVNALESHLNEPETTWPKAGGVSYPGPFYGGKPPDEQSVIDALKAVNCYIAKPPNMKKPYPELWEFPLQDSEFKGGAQGSQGPDRVIVKVTNNAVNGAHPKPQYTDFVYCISTTHRDQTGNNVAPCPNKTS